MKWISNVVLRTGFLPPPENNFVSNLELNEQQFFLNFSSNKKC